MRINIITFCYLVWNLSIQAQSLSEMPCTMDNSTWQSGEKLTYKVYYNWQFVWIPAGEVVFNIQEKGDYYYIDVKGYSYESYDWFFTVRDHYRSRVDKVTFQPDWFVRDVQEGSYIRYDSLSFDYTQGVIHEYFGKTKHTAEYFQFPMDDCVQDMVSILYYLRNYDEQYLKPNEHLPINVFFDKEYFDLKIKIVDVREEKIKGVGKKNVIHLAPQIVTGNVFKEGNEMNILVNNDVSKIPLQIESQVTVGSVKAVLVDAQNTLSNPF